MFEFLRGKIAQVSPLKAVIDVGGVGYAVLIPLNCYTKMPSLGSEITLYVTQVVREDSHQLYGFLTPAGKELFEKFTQISGIGPKTGLALVGHLEIDQLMRAVAEGNIALISKVPGIGKKTAERLIIELRDKLKNLDKSVLQTPEGRIGGNYSDALNALINLGYNQIHAQNALKAALASSKEELSLSSLITAALRSL